MSDEEIRDSIENGEIVISGYNPLYIGSSSVDLHLDNKAQILDDKKFAPKENIDLREREKSYCKFTEINGWENIVINPGSFYLLSSKERIKFPDDIVGFIQGRSSIARIGLNVHAAGFFDSGFEGNATLEVTNFTKHPIIIPENTRICQMVFAKMGKKSINPYWKKLDAKYRGQSGPNATKIYEDYK